MSDYGARASADLIVTRGKGFVKEKNKKKRCTLHGSCCELWLTFLGASAGDPTAEETSPWRAIPSSSRALQGSLLRTFCTASSVLWCLHCWKGELGEARR